MEIDTHEIEAKSLPVVQQANLILVTDNGTMEKANSFKVTIKGMIKEVDAFFEPFEKQAFQLHRSLTSKHKEVNKPLEEADQYVTGQVKAFLRKIEEERQREEARLREEARKLEEERLLREAEELEKEGRHEEAQKIIDEPVTFVLPTVKVETPKVDMRSYRPIRKARVTDFNKFVLFVSVNWGFMDCLQINESNLNRRVKDGNTMNIPYIEVYEA